ncbi:MAG: ornithine cyclodeaminase family protein [Desulfobacula sp.]|nr:ornithine cyclodeaminase family protein [Desulfobacula sp.]
MLFLNKHTILKIDHTIIQNAVEDAYKLILNSNYNMPDRMHVPDNNNTLLLMPCFSRDFFATKLVTVFPEAQRHGQPAVNGILVLCDNISGKPLAVMDGAALTAQRTGAVGGVAVKCLTDQSIKTAGIFGAGVQGLSQARYLLFNRKIKTLYICDLKKESAKKMSSILKTEFDDVEYIISENPNQMVEKSQVIIAATTSRKPLFKADQNLIKSKTFISIGSFQPDMQEFPETIITSADDILVDTMFAVKESGDIAIPIKNSVITKDKIKEFAKILEEDIDPKNKTILFKSVGMALFDLSVASAVYKLALENNIGQKLDF